MVVFKKLQHVKEIIIQLVVLLDYNCSKNYYRMMAMDLSKQQALDADPKAIQQINFTRNVSRPAVATMFFIIEELSQYIN